LICSLQTNSATVLTPENEKLQSNLMNKKYVKVEEKTMKINATKLPEIG